MKEVIYLFSSGKIKRRNNTLYFEHSTGEGRFMPVERLGEVFVFGEVDLNKRLLEFLSKKGIVVHFFNYYDFYVGSFYPREKNNSGLITLYQATHYTDREKRLYLARKFIEGAMKNMLRVLRYYHTRGKDLGKYIEKIENALESLEKVPTCEILMGIEGRVREVYYRAFDRIIEKEGFEFRARSRKPPRNRLNALISFGNHLLYLTVLSEIYRTHLDPRIGFLHYTNRRSFSLNLDIAEIFKPVIVDRLILHLINHRIIKEGHFRKRSKGVYLTEEGMKVFVKEWEKRLKTTIKCRKLGRNVSYRQLIRLELYKLEQHLTGEGRYEPYVMK